MSLVQLPSNQNQSKSVFPSWVLFRSCAYLTGRGITFGDAIVPHPSKTQGRTSLNVDIMLSPHVDIVDYDLKMLADQQYDHVFVGPRLKNMQGPQKMLKDLAVKLREGGHLIICQKVEHWSEDAIRAMIADCGRWQAKDSYLRDGVMLQIYKKTFGKKGILPAKPRSGKKRVCICRYGALGDMIILSPLIHQLHDDGYEVTMNAAPYALPVIENNPYVDNIIIQEREMIPNPALGEYWKEWEKEYDRYINLSESLEGRFLKVEGRRDFFTTKEWRIKTGEHNYYDYTMAAGGYPDAKGKLGELFFTTAEERNVQKFFSQHKGKFVVIWALNGSSHHKIYPQMEVVLHEWLTQHDNSVIVLVGDPNAKQPEYQHMRLISKVGEWGIRDSLCAAKFASCVLGPETMMTNAAGSLGTPVITFLSHSTHEALCKYFPNDFCLAPEGIACYPCFQLHYTLPSCPLQQMVSPEGQILAEAPACAMSGIAPARVLARLEEVFQKHFHPQSDKLVMAN